MLVFVVIVVIVVGGGDSGGVVGIRACNRARESVYVDTTTLGAIDSCTVSCRPIANAVCTVSARPPRSGNSEG